MYSGTNTFIVISASPKTYIPYNRQTRLCPNSSVLGITEIEGGFPHSEIRGSKVVRTSPRLIAAYHVLHRLSAPRHPPDTLIALDRSHYRYPPPASALGRAHCRPPNGSDHGSDPNGKDTIERPVLLQACPGTRGQATFTTGMLAPANPHGPGQNDRTYFLFTMSDICASSPKALTKLYNGRDPSKPLS